MLVTPNAEFMVANISKHVPLKRLSKFTSQRAEWNGNQNNKWLWYSRIRIRPTTPIRVVRAFTVSWLSTVFDYIVISFGLPDIDASALETDTQTSGRPHT